MGVYELSGAGSLKTPRTVYSSMNANNGDSYGALVPIASTTFDGTSGSATFSNINQSYQDLRLVASVRSNFSGGSLINLIIRFNGLQSPNYSRTMLYGTGSSVISTRETSLTGIYPGSIPSSVSTAGVFGSATVDILNYKSGQHFKTCISRVTSDLNGSGTTELNVGLWRSTFEITSLQIFDVNGNTWAAGSTVTLYGIRAVA